MYAEALNITVVNGASIVAIPTALDSVPELGDALLIGGVWYEVAGGTVHTAQLVSPVAAATGAHAAMLLRFTSGHCAPAFAADSAYQLAKMNQKLGTELFQFLTQPNPVDIHDYSAAENTLVTIQAASYIQSIYPNVSMTYAGDSIPKSDKRGEIDIMWFDSETFRLVDLLHTSSLVSSPIYAQTVLTQPLTGPNTLLTLDINKSKFFKIYGQQSSVTLSLTEPLVQALAVKKVQTVRVTVVNLGYGNVQFAGATVKVDPAAAAVLADASLAASAVTFDVQWVPDEYGASGAWVVTNCTPRFQLGIVNTPPGYYGLVWEDNAYLLPVGQPSPDTLTGAEPLALYANGYSVQDQYTLKALARKTPSQFDTEVKMLVGPYWHLQYTGI